MNKVLDRLRSGVTPRNPGPLQNLIFSWGDKRDSKERLPFSQELLIESINERPCLNRKDRSESLGWGAKKFQTAMEGLEQQGFVETQTIPSGNGRPSAHLLLTDKGYSYLKRLRVAERRLHGGLVHHCAMLKLANHFKANGYRTRVNHKLTPKLIVDVLCEREDERGVLEVVNSNNAKRDAEKCEEMADKVGWIQLVATTRELYDHYVSKIGSQLTASVREKIQISFVDDLLEAEG